MTCPRIIVEPVRMTMSSEDCINYVQILEFEDDDEYCTAVAENVEQARQLLDTGFEYICTHKDEMLFRKRK